MTVHRPRPATPADAADIARIYTQGIEDRSSTFETRPRTAADITPWFDGTHPIVVVERGDQVTAFASTSLYRPRDSPSSACTWTAPSGAPAPGRPPCRP